MRWTAEGLVYPCFCTRKEIADEIARAVEAPHFDGPRRARWSALSRHLPPSFRRPSVRRASRRRSLCLAAGCRQGGGEARGPLKFREQDEIVAVDPLRFGDLVLARKDVPASYHLAVVVDDAFQGVTLVTRGEDLLPATHVQRLLQALLALPEPAYAHHRLILDDQGRKFSKRDQAVTLRALRQGGATPADILTRLGL